MGSLNTGRNWKRSLWRVPGITSDRESKSDSLGHAIKRLHISINLVSFM